MPLDTLQVRPPNIFGYSTILPSVWIVVAVTASTLLPGTRLGIVGTALMFMGAAALTCWLFARRHRRHFTRSEFWRIVVYSAVWAWLIEGFVLLTVVVLPQAKNGHVEAKPLLFAVLFTIVIDSVFIWGAFWKTGKSVIAWQLRNLEANASNSDGRA